MACCKPIIASIDGEGKNVIVNSKCGYVSPSEDHILLSKSIIKLMNLSVNERKTMGLNGRKFFEEHFEREKQLDRLLRILNE